MDACFDRLRRITSRRRDVGITSGRLAVLIFGVSCQAHCRSIIRIRRDLENDYLINPLTSRQTSSVPSKPARDPDAVPPTAIEDWTQVRESG